MAKARLKKIKNSKGSIALWLIIIFIFVMILLPFAAGIIKLSSANNKISRARHVLQIVLPQAWHGFQEVYISDNKEHVEIKIDEIAVREILTQTAVQNLNLNSFSNFSIEQIDIEYIDLYYSNENVYLHTPRIIMHLTLQGSEKYKLSHTYVMSLKALRDVPYIEIN